MFHDFSSYFDAVKCPTEAALKLVLVLGRGVGFFQRRAGHWLQPTVRPGFMSWRIMRLIDAVEASFHVHL